MKLNLEFQTLTATIGAESIGGDLKKILTPIHVAIGLTPAWWTKVELICNKLIDTYRGDGDKEWWSKILSYEQHGFGSGAYVTYDGWFLRDLLNISKTVDKHEAPKMNRKIFNMSACFIPYNCWHD